MAGRPLGSDDIDFEHLDNLIALGGEIRDLVERIKDVSDNPDVLHLALKIEAAALIIQKRNRDYRPRLKALKRKSRQKKKPSQKPLVRAGQG